MSRTSRVLLFALTLVVAPLSLLGQAAAVGTDVPVLVTTPSLSGTARVGESVTADPGTWSPEASAYSFTWLRDGAVITTTTGPTRVLVPADRDHRISVRVTASNADGSSEPATSGELPPVAAGLFAPGVRPTIAGARRWDHTATANPGSSVPAPTSIGYRWYRDGSVIPGATQRRYRLTVADFGKRLEVRVTLHRAGYAALTRTSGSTATIGHRVGVRRTFTYSIATRGAIKADLGQFARQVAETYAHPRGWRSAGYAFRQVARGGDFTVYLAASSTLPGFGSPCSTTWSCRVGRNVIINQARWLHASPAWNAAGLRLRDYRHMVVDHETGHWLGHRHATCPGKGRLAPVMMQQSKGLGGCRFNPFPLPGERWTGR